MAQRQHFPAGNRGEPPSSSEHLGTPWQNDLHQSHEREAPWLMSYLDFMTVLVTLFVLLYAGEKARERVIETPNETETVEQAAEASDAETEAVAEQTPPEPVVEPTAAQPAVLAIAEETAPRAESQAAPTEASASAAPPSAPPSAPDQIAAAVAAAPVDAGTTAEAATPNQTETPVGNAATASVPPEQANPPQSTMSPILGELGDRVTVRQDSQKLLMEISDTILFMPGSAELSGGGMALLNELMPALAEHAGRFTVEGHSDDRPIATSKYPSNWELSSARASVVTRHLVGQGIAADRISPVGRADTQPRGDNASAEGRAQNRRVVIVLHTD